ncbi:MAG: hypothetical protein AAB402_01600 [Patescibacteria group bacterium]
MTSKPRNNPTLWIAAVVIGGISGLTLLHPDFGYAAYSEPLSNPPQYNVSTVEIPEFINGAAFAQQKKGSLLIGERNGALSNCTTDSETGCSRLCLNPDLTNFPGTTDSNPATGNCITSWPMLTSRLISSGGSYVRRQDNPAHSDNAIPDPPGDTIDNGAFSIQAKPYTYSSSNQNAQLITLIAEAPDSASANTPTGIYSEALTDASYAATFAGRLAVVGGQQQICLNDSLNGNLNDNDCISNWTDITASQAAIVRLQNLGLDQRITSDSGNTAAGGSLVAGSLVAGGPTSATSSDFSCGDGICSIVNNETRQNCSADCKLPIVP